MTSADTTRSPRTRRGTFAPVVLLGLAGAGLAAAGATRTWYTVAGAHSGVPSPATQPGAVPPGVGGSDLAAFTGTLTGTDVNPLVGALALVALAAWGAVLVLRGGVRRAAAALGALASLGALWGLLDAVVGREAPPLPGGAADAGETMSAWPVATAIALVVTLAAFALAVRDAGRWPAMSSRYDSPAGAPAAGSTAGSTADAGEEPGEADQRSLWRALDEGRDPTS